VRKADLLGGCIGVTFSLAVCYGALGMPMGTLGDPGPGFLPFWVGVALATISLVLIASALLDGARQARARAGQRGRVAGILAGLLLYALALEALGYLVTTFLLLSAFLAVLGHRRWAVVLAFAVLATGGSYALFSLWLRVPLPRGVLLP